MFLKNWLGGEPDKMYINELRIDDFGCFRNARLENLDDSLVVIGGPQRAGKTTFMQVLRQFPDGINRGGDLPPANDEYRIDAEITHNDDEYRFVLNGYSSPSVSPIDNGPEIEAKDIFSPVTERQYRKLYTISLDELRMLPPGIDDSEDLARVLLGGAYGDIAEIPEIQNSFKEQAKDIGLKRGDPNTKTSKLYNPYKKIQEGMKARKEASRQVDRHKSVSEELKKKLSRQEEIKKEINDREKTRNRLNILNELYEGFQKFESLNKRLEDVDSQIISDFPTHLTDRLEHFEDKFKEATENLTESRKEFEEDARLDNTDEYYGWLLEHEKEINRLTEDRKLLEKTSENLIELGEDLERKVKEIERKISSMHTEWSGSFVEIDNIKTSMVDTARVKDLASKLKELKTKRSDLKDEVESASTQKKELESELEEMEEEQIETKEITVPKRQPAIAAAIAIAIGTAVGFIATSIIGGVVGLILLGIGLYLIDSKVPVETNFDADPYRELRSQVKTLESQIKAKSQQIEQIEKRINNKESELTKLVRELGLPEELPPSEVPEFYENAVKLNKKIETYREEKNEWETEKKRFKGDLQEISKLIGEITELSWTPKEPLKNPKKVLKAFEKLDKDLELAKEVEKTESRRISCIEDIDSVLTEWDRELSINPSAKEEVILQYIERFNKKAEEVKEIKEMISEQKQLKNQIKTRLDNKSAQKAFKPLQEENEPWIDVFRKTAAEYADTDEIADKIQDQNKKIDELKKEQRSLNEESIKLEQQKEELASEKDLIEAREKIEEGRVEFERLGEEYAVNRIAEKMMDQLNERLMEDIVYSLIEDASKIFSEITQEYNGIKLEGNIQNLQFEAIRKNKPNHSTKELSRATAEQLFLAIRLARIQQTDVSLPIILDDATTNFDPNHLNRVFKVINQLSGKNQVFFLTCHPQCIQITKTKNQNPQYWSLKNGKFTRHKKPETLEKQLTTKQ